MNSTIILSEGCFVAIISTAAYSLFLAQLIKFFLSLTFANHVFASPAERPPLLKREVIDFGSEVWRYPEIFLILIEDPT
jgi:hypothetical protein